MVEVGFISATTLIKITLMLLSFGFAFTLALLYREINKVKKAIATICAADPKLTEKVNKFLKPMIDIELGDKKEEDDGNIQ